MITYSVDTHEHYKKKALIVLYTMYNNAKSLEQLNQVKLKCRVAKVNYLILTSMDEFSFNLAMEFDQIENFYE